MRNLLIIGVFVFLSINCSNNKLETKIRTRVLSYNFEGIVVKKYISSRDRERIEIKDDSSNVFVVDLFWKKKFFYNFFKIGDFVIKKKDESKIRVIRKDLDTILEFKLSKLLSKGILASGKTGNK